MAVTMTGCHSPTVKNGGHYDRLSQADPFFSKVIAVKRGGRPIWPEVSHRFLVDVG